MLAHDINNALQHLVMMTEDIGYSCELDTDQRANLDHTLAVTRYATELVKQLLGNEPARPRQPLGLNAIIREMAAALPVRPRSPIQCELTLADNLHPIHANVHQIQRLVVNLLNNASDAMPDGGTVTLLTVNETIDDTLSRQLGLPRGGAYVRLTVSDTGPGIPESVAALIFEPGFTTNPEGSSLGLGLTIVAQVAREAGGMVTLRPTMYTTFDVLLPAIPRRLS